MAGYASPSPRNPSAHLPSFLYNTQYNAGPRLPAGRCGFKDLSLGHSCGCRRFWQNTDERRGLRAAPWCFCGHHACFHKARGDSASPERQLLPADERLQRPPVGLGISRHAFKPDPPQTQPEYEIAPTECSIPPLGAASPNQAGRTFMDSAGRLRHMDVLVEQNDTDATAEVVQEAQVDPQDGVNQPNVNDSMQRIFAQLASVNAAIANTPNFQRSLLTLSSRIDALESTSFGHAPSRRIAGEARYV